MRIDHVGDSLPWLSPLGVVIVYMVVRQLLMMWLSMLVGAPRWREFWSMDAGLGLALPTWFHIVNAFVIAFVIVDFWRHLAHSQARRRSMFFAYVAAIVVLVGMQHCVWPTW
jgi:hypothetical protein